MRKRIEKGLSIKPKKNTSNQNFIFVSESMKKSLDEAYKIGGYKEYLKKLHEGHPMSKKQ